MPAWATVENQTVKTRLENEFFLDENRSDHTRRVILKKSKLRRAQRRRVDDKHTGFDSRLLFWNQSRQPNCVIENLLNMSQAKNRHDAILLEHVIIGQYIRSPRG